MAEQARQDPQVLEYGFSAYKLQYSPGWTTSFAVIVKNPNPNTWVASATYLTVTFRDAAGNVVLTDDLATLSGLGPGQTSAVAGTDSGAKAPAQATTMDVQVTRVTWLDLTQVAPGDVTMSTATVRPSPEDTVTPTAFITCPARSTYRSKISNVYAEIVYRDGAGKIIGGSAHNSDVNHDTLTLPGNSTRAIQIKALFVPPTGVPAAVCYPSYHKPL